MRAAGRELPDPTVRVDVLGPLRLTVGDVVVEVPGPKRRALLALLVMAEGRSVPVDGLLDALWPNDLPNSARGTLHSHVSRLRGHLGPAAGRLERSGDGYRLRLDGAGSGSDVALARSLLAAAGAAGPAAARAQLAEARSLWRGEPLAEFADVAPLAAWAVRLGELRRAVDEAFAAATLGAGSPADAIELATALVVADPQSEPGVLVLMRALDAAGRSAEALRAAFDHRRRLVTESGLGPSPAVDELEREIASRAPAPAGRLPRPTGRLYGRDSERAALHRLLEHERLVTVLGPGGVGKSRLATDLAARADRATALLLAPVTEPDAIPHALAAALDLRPAGVDVLAACAALLGAGPQLLVVDNCEHLLAGVRHVLTVLLDACPDLTVLATSREPLGLAAEQRLRLAPLSLSLSPDGGDVGRSPAAALFVERARRVRPGFAPGHGELALVHEIVRRLDGLPLAIELAAGRLPSLDLGELRDRLDRSLDLLGDRRLTLRQTLEWSYDLLPGHEQRLFRHLAVFPAGVDLATAEAVGAGLALPVDAAGALSHLVDASMVEVEMGDPTRYSMLDTMRSFALDQLDVLGEADMATERFVRWALDLAAWVDTTVASADEPAADRRLRRELANLRAAWRICRGRHRLDEAIRLAIGLSDAAGWRDLTEVWSWHLELADEPELTTHPQAGFVLGLAAGSAWSRGELEHADELVVAGLEAGGGDWPCLAAWATIALSRGELHQAVDLGRRAAALAERPDQTLGVAGLAAAYAGDLGLATELAERLAALARSPTVEGFACYVAAEAHALAGRRTAAEKRYEEAIALTRASGATFVEGIASVGLMTVRVAAGRVTEALEGYRALIDYWERTGGWIQLWTTLRNFAGLLRTLGDEETALFLDDAADRAPDAPPLGEHPREPNQFPLRRRSEVRAEAAAASRSRVLDVARIAIDRHAVEAASARL